MSFNWFTLLFVRQYYLVDIMNIVVKKEADIQGLSANREKTDNGIMKLSYNNGNWVGTYDPVKKLF